MILFLSGFFPSFFVIASRCRGNICRIRERWTDISPLVYFVTFICLSILKFSTEMHTLLHDILHNNLNFLIRQLINHYFTVELPHHIRYHALLESSTRRNGRLNEIINLDNDKNNGYHELNHKIIRLKRRIYI